MTEKIVAEVWFSIEPCNDNILRFRESHVNSYAVGNIWLARGSGRDLAIDTGSEIVAPVPLFNTVSGKPVTAIALNCSYDHAGGWYSFSERLCHPLDAPFLEKPDAEHVSIADYLNDETLWSLPWKD